MTKAKKPAGKSGRSRKVARAARAESPSNGRASAGRPAGERRAGRRPSGQPPSGQRLWDMPYSAPAPRMINPQIGLHNLVARAGHNAGYDIDLTLLDAPDHRLIRSGVLLAHRVLDGRGEWYLGAPDWVPLLPKERIDPMSHGDLPEELADLVRPFRRRATLGPVAALRCERREFALRDDGGTTLALLRDDKVTVRRGGLTTARYREVMLTPIGPGLSEDQDLWLLHVLDQAGATQVEKFPRLVTRLGAPSNGLTDFPPPAPFDASAGFGGFVTALLSHRLRQILEADLAVRADRLGAAADLARHATQLRRDVRALAPALDGDWVEDLDEELEWLGEEAAREVDAQDRGRGDGRGGLKARLRSERYLALLEGLVTAARAPRVGESSGRPASEVLDDLLVSAENGLSHTVERLNGDAPVSAWDAVRSALEAVLHLCDVVEHLQPGRVDQLRDRLQTIQNLLAEAVRQAQLAQATRELAAGSSVTEAFELGRRYEHEITEARAAQAAFTRQWSRTVKKLGPMLTAVGA